MLQPMHAMGVPRKQWVLLEGIGLKDPWAVMFHSLHHGRGLTVFVACPE